MDVENTGKYVYSMNVWIGHSSNSFKKANLNNNISNELKNIFANDKHLYLVLFMPNSSLSLNTSHEAFWVVSPSITCFDLVRFTAS